MLEIHAIFYIVHGITAILQRNHKNDMSATMLSLRVLGARLMIIDKASYSTGVLRNEVGSKTFQV